MKKNLIPVVLLVLCATAIFVHSCKKSSVNSLQAQKDEQASEKALIAAKISKEGITRTIVLNQKLGYDFVDASGHVIPKAQVVKPGSGTADDIVSACDFTNDDEFTINRIAISQGCNASYQLTWTYTISTNNNIVQTNPYFSTYNTEGQIAVYNGGSPVYTDNVSPATIVDQGADPGRLGYEIFTVTFSTTNAVSAAYFASPYTFKMGAFIATDCGPDGSGNYQNLLFLIHAVTPLANVCNRIDPVYQAISSPPPLRFYGEATTGCPSSLTLPDLQEVQYSTDGGSTWVGGSTSSSTLSYYLPPSSGAPYDNFLGSSHYGYIDVNGALELQITLGTGSYTVQVRSRNVKFNGPSSSYTGGEWPIPNISTNCCVGPWSTSVSYSVTY